MQYSRCGALQNADDYYRFCPGEEHARISDAICFGRRRAAFPNCKGCRFNDDEKAERERAAKQRAGTLPPEEDPTVVDEVFKAYDVRGTYPAPLNEDVAWRVGHAAAQFLRTSLRGFERSQGRANSIVVGRDMRRSSPSLAAALTEGARAAGAGVVDVGMIDTSQIYFAINHLGTCGGIQTTASHNPKNYNGFKISGQHGRPIGAETGLSEICRIARNMVKHETGVSGPLEEGDLTDAYKQFIRQFLNPARKLKVAVDASNGMAGKWFPILFGDIDELEVVPLNFKHAGEFVHEPNPLVDANLKQLQQAVEKHKAQFGVCFDGDADRCMLVDDRAQIVRCDLLTALLARSFLRHDPGDTVVYDLRSSRVVPEEIERAGGVPRRERVGHAFMKKAMHDTKAVFGGELSGHFYFRDNFYCDSGMLAFVHVVNVLTAQKKTLSQLIRPLRRLASSGERNFKNDDKDGTINALAERYEDARIDFLDGITVEYDQWWFNVRKSNTEPLLRLNLEAENRKLMQGKLAEVARQLGAPVDR